MSKPFGHIPKEPPAIRSLDGLAPKFLAALLSVYPNLAELVSETLRTDERQEWLHGFGRSYDDDRGIVTMAATADHGWHKFGLAVDLKRPPTEEEAEKLRAANISLGMDWQKFVDPPHLQWGEPMRQAPSERAADLYRTEGVEALWRVVGAT